MLNLVYRFFFSDSMFSYSFCAIDFENHAMDLHKSSVEFIMVNYSL